MSRKLIHSLRALAVSFGILAVGAMIATPHRADRAETVQTALVRSESATPVAEQADAAKPTASHRLRRKQARDALTLPFFSFAQVLRRGNGS